MEIFVDFGLFEVLLALGFGALARRVYSRRLTAGAFLFASLLFPVALVVVAPTEVTRWLAAACLATALVNGGLILTLLRRGGALEEMGGRS